MSTELTDVKDFIKAIAPFDGLTESLLSALIKEISICYVREGEQLPAQGIDKPSLYVIRKGSLRSANKNNELIGKFAEGDICALFCSEQQRTEQQQTEQQYTGQNEDLMVTAEEDTLLYAIDFDGLKTVCQSFPNIVEFFSASAANRLSKKVAEINEQAVVASTLMNTAISHFYHGPAVTIDVDESIQAAAIKMTELNFSCLLVVKDDALVGIVTDKDFRRRCIAQGLSLTAPVGDIMSESVHMIDVKARAYDALIKMNSAGIHHLPVGKNGQLAGMVTITDLMKQEGHNAVNMSSMIAKAHSVDELANIAKLLPKLQISMRKLGTTAENVGKTMSAITNAFTRKLIAMAIEKFGDAPVPFAWVSAGSQARQEQTVNSDQDNALIIDDAMQSKDEPWFKQLAEFVCDGLAECGYVYCPGNVMASNDKWRQKQAVWQGYFDKWVNQPEPLALMNSSIFFDLNTVYGEERYLQALRERVLAKTQRNTLFLAHLSANAVKLRPPLGFFRDFVLIDNGKHKKTLDLKHNGIAPIVDLARIYALSEGICEVNTLERLKQAAGTPSLSKDAAGSLISAFEFLTMLKVEHQVDQLLADDDTDNYLAPNALSQLDREHLKDAFKVIKSMQSVRQTTYG